MAHIHFVNYERDMRRLDAAAHLWESCCWVLGDSVRGALLPGGRVYFHDTQTSPSFFGGTITAFRETPTEKSMPRRWAIEFVFDEEARGVLAGSGGWKRESKFIA